MAETSATKLGEITKKFKAVNKYVIEPLEYYGQVVKSSTSVVTEEQAARGVEILTQNNSVTQEELIEMREAAKAEKEAEIAEEKAKKEAEEKGRVAILLAEEKAKKEAKAKAREAAEEVARKKRKAEEKEKKEKQKKHVNLAKKQEGVRIDLSSIDNSNTEEEFVVKSEKKSRTVDTKTTNVELR